jgi:hypothetical protein
MISEAMPTFLYTDEGMGFTGSRRKVDDFVKPSSLTDIHPNNQPRSRLAESGRLLDFTCPIS